MEIIRLIILAIIAYWITGIIHELGHIVVGLINGWEFGFLTVGPIGLKANEQGRVVIYFEKNILYWGGVGAALPRKKESADIDVWKKVLIGGPIASITTGLIFLPVGLYRESQFLLILGAMSLGMGIMNGLPLPLKSGILYTDGGRWSRLNSKGQKYLEEKSLFTITQTMIASDSFKDISYTDIEPLIQSEDHSVRYYGYFYSYRYYKEHGNHEKMNESIAQMNELKPKVSKIIIEDCKIS